MQFCDKKHPIKDKHEKIYFFDPSLFGCIGLSTRSIKRAHNKNGGTARIGQSTG